MSKVVSAGFHALCYVANCFDVLVVKEGHTITHTPDTVARGHLRVPSTTVHWIFERYLDILTAILFNVECDEPLSEL